MRIFLDGLPFEFEGNPTILEVARANGVNIPSLCEYPGLEPFAACRLCLVEVKGRRGYVPACHTRAEEGLEVRTATPEIQSLRRGILELILAEHPHACLICAEKASCEDYKSTIRKVGEVTGCVLCPVNGRCDLQRAVEAVGVERVHFPALRRAGEVRRDDPFIDRDNSLCILCGRCVRVCQEIRGASVLTFVFRGSETVIGTARNRRLVDSGCRFCGACVDACPTGSLADRGGRYAPLPEAEKQTLCPFCSQGCRLRLGLRGARVLGAAPDPDGPANHGQACVKGRFLVKSALVNPRRRLRPMVRKDGALRESTWEEALDTAARRLAALSAEETAVTGSAQSSCEDLFVLHRFAREALKAQGVIGSWAGSPALALRGLTASAGLRWPLNFRFTDVGAAGAIIQFGEDLPATQPMLGLEVYRASRSGAALVRVGAGGPGGGASTRVEIPAGAEGTFVGALLAVLRKEPEAKPVVAEGLKDFDSAAQTFHLAAALRTVRVPREQLVEIARLLITRQPVFVLFGQEFMRTDGRSEVLAWLWNLAAFTGARLIPLESEANLRGALEFAVLFPPADAAGEKARVLYLAGPGSVLRPAKRDFVVVQGPYHDENDEIADVVFPETTAFEADGTFVNAEGRAQLSGRAVEPAGEARPGWRILADLAARMGVCGFDYGSVGDIRNALATAVSAFRNLPALSDSAEGIFLDEGEARPPAFIRTEPAPGRRAEARAKVLTDPDEYRGLHLARENKSLRLIRGR
jgi:formate dehydrogenase alpha subunit